MWLFVCARGQVGVCEKGARLPSGVCGSYGPGQQASLGEECHRVLR